MYVLLSVCLVLHPQRIDESLQAILREKPHAERIVRMQKGELQVSLCLNSLNKTHKKYYKFPAILLGIRKCLCFRFTQIFVPCPTSCRSTTCRSSPWTISTAGKSFYGRSTTATYFTNHSQVFRIKLYLYVVFIINLNFCLVIYVCTLLCLSLKWLRFWKCPILISVPICYASNIKWRMSFGLKALLDWTANSNLALR
jgi:hypothetical protein